MITPIQTFAASVVQCGSFALRLFRGHSRANAACHEELESEARLAKDAHRVSHCGAPSRAKGQCRPDAQKSCLERCESRWRERFGCALRPVVAEPGRAPPWRGRTKRPWGLF